MRLSLGHALHQEVLQATVQAPVLAQRVLLLDQQINLRVQLVGSLRDERYEPRGDCPKCNMKLRPSEILSGFLRDEKDFTTLCTRCHHRFEPRLISFGNVSQIELPFLCSVQVRGQLRSVAHLSPAEIAQQFPGEYRSAVIHYGTLSALFRSLGIEYGFPEILEWEAKTMPFLGKMPDTVIATCVGVTDYQVNRLRRRHNILAYNRRRALEQIVQSQAT